VRRRLVAVVGDDPTFASLADLAWLDPPSARRSGATDDQDAEAA
jgi:hypothetical protein